MACVIVTPATTPLLTTAQAKQHLREDLVDADNDALIDSLVLTATRAAEDRTGRSLLNTTWRLTLDEWPHVVRLPRGRIVSVTSVAYVDTGGVKRTLDPSVYLCALDDVPGRIVPTWGTCWPVARCQPAAIEVVFVAGYGTEPSHVPLPIRQWVKLALTDLYQRRGRSSDKPVVPQDFAEGLLHSYEIWNA